MSSRGNETQEETEAGIEAMQVVVDLRARNERLMEAMELAWGVIANATDWDNGARAEWRAAAERWRDEHYHPSLDRTGEAIEEV